MGSKAKDGIVRRAPLGPLAKAARRTSEAPRCPPPPINASPCGPARGL
jgi:hypothetical protein